MTDIELPIESQMNREDALEAFLEVINVIEPEHPYTEIQYPLQRSHVDFGVTRSHHARCGAKRDEDSPIAYKTRMTHIQNISRENHISLLTHEVTHVNIESSYFASNHPPVFWIQMARHARIVRKSLESGRLSKVFPNASIDDYEEAIINNPNSSIVDQRFWTVEDCKNQISKFIKDDSYEISQPDYNLMRPGAKKVKYRHPRYDSLREIELIEFPGIGKRVVEKIGSEFDTVDEMVSGKKLNSKVVEAVPAQFHDELWAELRTHVDLKKAPTTDEGEKIVKPGRDVFLTEDGRALPSDEILEESMTQEYSNEPGIGLFGDDPDDINVSGFDVGH